MRRAGLSYRISWTEGPGHARDLAQGFVQEGVGKIAVLGGDGTINEVINGIVGSSVQLGLLPVGTGNDLARSLGIPFNRIDKAVEILAGGRVEAIDAGWEGGRIFSLMVGVGFPAAVAEQANRSRLRGSAAFFASVYGALRRMETIPVVLTLDGATRDLRCTSILIQNTPFCGGGQRMAPQASLSDGLLDVVVIGPIGKANLMLHFPRVYRGTHVDHPAFSVFRARTVEIETGVELPKMLDGDILGSTPVAAKALPAALKVIVPLK